MNNLLKKTRAGEKITEFGIIDLHGHLGEMNFGIAENNCESLIEDMDRTGIKIILTSHIQCLGTFTEAGNQEMHSLIEPYKERIYGYATFRPTTYEDVKEKAEYWYSQGFIGQKYHNGNGISYIHPSYKASYEFANKHKIVILYHTWGDEKTFSEISEVSKKYPETSILLAHTGCTNTEGYISMAKKHENVFLDLATSTTNPSLIKNLVKKIGSEKITFGSDATFFSLTNQIGKVTGADISENDMKNIFSTNAEKILARIC